MSAAEENATDWFVLRGSERGGPYPYAFLREGARGGLISRCDLVWRPGWDDWRGAGGMDGLFAGHDVAPDPAPGERGSGPQRPTSNPLPPTPQNFAFGLPAEEADEAPSNYVMGHWRGEFSVPAALCGNSLVVGFILVIAASAFYTIVEQTKLGTIPLTMVAIVLLVACLASIVWLSVGVWRSVSRHRSRGGAGCRTS
jgi:GYF domain 2